MSRHQPAEAQDLDGYEAFVVALLTRAIADAKTRRESPEFLHDPDGAGALCELVGLGWDEVHGLFVEALL